MKPSQLLNKRITVPVYNVLRPKESKVVTQILIIEEIKRLTNE